MADCPALREQLRTTALCSTDHPADAVAALIGAAVAILDARFEPAAIVHLLGGAMNEAVAQLAASSPCQDGPCTA